MFPISRDPPEGGTFRCKHFELPQLLSSFQFLGIPPKGERPSAGKFTVVGIGFQFLGIPPKGEREDTWVLVGGG